LTAGLAHARRRERVFPDFIFFSQIIL
jgi:hypothetical protein